MNLGTQIQLDMVFNRLYRRRNHHFLNIRSLFWIKSARVDISFKMCTDWTLSRWCRQPTCYWCQRRWENSHRSCELKWYILWQSFEAYPLHQGRCSFGFHPKIHHRWHNENNCPRLLIKVMAIPLVWSKMKAPMKIRWTKIP